MNSVVVRAPTRLDFGGGWTDVPPYSTERGGRVCNLAIDRYAEVRIQSAPTNEMDVRIAADSTLARAAVQRAGVTGIRSSIRSDFPTGAGLGGSSAVGVAMSGALRTWRGIPITDRGAIAEESRGVEVEEAGIAGGRQDHYAAAFGGALDLTFDDHTSVRSLALSEQVRRHLERRCLVFYTGQSRISGDTIVAVLDAYAAGDARVLTSLERMKELAAEMSPLLERGDLDALGEAVGEHWVHQRALHPSIPTPRIDEVLATARRAGAIGGKALGASGGGCVLVVAASGTEEAVRAAVSPLALPLAFRMDNEGLRLVSIEETADA
ncbi:MAG: GHMP family kinase ATP-binding protein [Gemmatimonadaceae bacterium]